MTNKPTSTGNNQAEQTVQEGPPLVIALFRILRVICQGMMDRITGKSKNETRGICPP